MNIQTKVLILVLTLIIYSDLSFTDKQRSRPEILTAERVTAIAIPDHALKER